MAFISAYNISNLLLLSFKHLFLNFEDDVFEFIQRLMPLIDTKVWVETLRGHLAPPLLLRFLRELSLVRNQLLHLTVLGVHKWSLRGDLPAADDHLNFII
jgi:hypothetical protein